MLNFRLDVSCVDDLLRFVQGKYPLSRDVAIQICQGLHPFTSCTQVYGVYTDDSELVSIMTATYAIVFPHEDGTRMVHLSGAYTKPSERHKGYAAVLLDAIEHDAKKYFHADYLCCDSVADALYEKFGFVHASCEESRLWKRLLY